MRIGACLTSFAVLLAAGGCAPRGDVAADSAVVTDSAGGHSLTRDTVTPVPPTSAAPTAAPDTATRDIAGRETANAAAPARSTADTARQAAPPSVAAAAQTTTPSTPERRDTAPASRDAAPTAPAPTQGPAQAPAQNPAPQQTAGQAADKLTVSQTEYNGWKTFAVNCVRCHGEDAIGSALAPSLVKALQGPVDRGVFVETVKKGRPEKGMPAWEALLSDKQVEELWAYLKARSDGRLAAGRPRVASGN